MRARAVWLLESTDPTGAAVMTMRRIRALRHVLSSTALAMSAGRVPAGSPLAGVRAANGLTGELHTARAQIVVTTSELTLISAAPRLHESTRLVHFVHTPLPVAYASERFMRTMPRVDRLVVPVDADPFAVARTTGVDPARVMSADDFVLPVDAPPSSATGHVILAAGRVVPGDGTLDLLEAFRIAAPDLPGWQLRIAGGGPGLDAVREQVDRHGLGTRAFVLGWRHDLAEHYLDAGFVVRLSNAETCGLSVVEALTAGLPVLTGSAVPAARRFVHDGVDGRVLDRVDPDTVAAALVELADDDRRAMLARKAREARLGTTEHVHVLRGVFEGVLS